MRLSKIVTKTGDKGKTSLGTGEKVSKDDLRILVLGEVDELNSFLGWARVVASGHPQDETLKMIQNHLFDLGGHLTMLGTDTALFSSDNASLIDNEITRLNKELPPLKEFILPGGNELSARIHIVRAICRRVETSLVSLAKTEQDIDKIIPYINRLSDYLFVLARFVNLEQGNNEDQWKR